MYEQQGFSFDQFGNAFGNTVQDVITGFGDTTTANALAAGAIANVNNAKADALRSQAESNRQLMKSIGIAVIALVVGVVLVLLLRPVLSKIKF